MQPQDKEKSPLDRKHTVTDELLKELIIDQAAGRAALTAAELAGLTIGGTLAANASREFASDNLGSELHNEYAAIRADEARRAKQMDQMIRTINKYEQQTGNKIEAFIPVKDRYAAGTLKDGTDVVMYDPSAPHAGIMAHELGHIDMNQTNAPWYADPMAYLQTSGVGRASGDNAAKIGAIGAMLGAVSGAGINRLRRKENRSLRDQAVATAIGGGLGTLGASGQAAYEILGASGRAFGYLPEDVSAVDTAGDLSKAGLTYVMGGPVTAATAAAGVGGAALLAAHAPTRRYVQRRAGDLMRAFLNSPAASNATTPALMLTSD